MKFLFWKRLFNTKNTVPVKILGFVGIQVFSVCLYIMKMKGGKE
jgi:hypothetical protein